ncbi:MULTISPECIES: hypothetical protein [unclassified Psychrobacter]|uniref:hypothetical protein n=1 Tax=unclassified Psychrobacter TaxID=196806 RepID=UPI0003FC3D77|nr:MULTISPECIES: hypothetical protein [unclassified Psychrobacter]
MKNKKQHPLLSKRAKVKAAKSRRKIWMAIILVLLFITIGYLVWAQSVPKNNKTSSSSPSISEQTEATQATMPVENVLSEANNDDAIQNENAVIDQNSDDADTRTDLTIQVPKPAAILNAPLPKTDSLAKEEIDRLEDERKRFAAQEKLAAEQLAMNKKLTEMKEDQIALIEQQIAQLEAENAGQTKVE